MNWRLGVISTSKSENEAIKNTGATHEMKRNYGYFFSYQQYSSAYYILLVNSDEYPTAG